MSNLFALVQTLVSLHVEQLDDTLHGIKWRSVGWGRRLGVRVVRGWYKVPFWIFLDIGIARLRIIRR